MGSGKLATTGYGNSGYIHNMQVHVFATGWSFVADSEYLGFISTQMALLKITLVRLLTQIQRDMTIWLSPPVALAGVAMFTLVDLVLVVLLVDEWSLIEMSERKSLGRLKTLGVDDPQWPLLMENGWKMKLTSPAYNISDGECWNLAESF